VDQVEEVKSKIDIVELISEYLPLKKAGRNWKGLCPFHGEKTPSFMVNPELQIFKCFGCSVGGDAFSFLQQMEGMEFGEALKLLAKRTGVTLTSYRPSMTEERKDRLLSANTLARDYYHFVLTKHALGKEAGKYLDKRGVTGDSVERYKLGFAPDGWDFLMKYLEGKKSFKREELSGAGLVVEGKSYDRFRNRIMFPLNNHRGQTVGFAGRVMPGADETAGGKYVNTPETEVYHKGDLLYGLDVNKTEIKTAGWVVVVEGELDSIASWQAGVKNVVAIKGSALTLKQVEILRRYVDTVVLALDADLAGDAAARRGIEVAQKQGLIVKIVNAGSEELNPKKYKDPGEWGIGDPEGWIKAVEAAIPIYDFYLESAVKRHGLDAVGKTKVGRELLPLWAGIDDEIMKAHYVKKLAGILEVGEEDVRKQMEKAINTSTSATKPSTPEAAKLPENTNTRREMVEEYLIGLAVRGGQISKLLKEASELIKSAFWVKVLETWDKHEGKTTKEKDIVAPLPKELRERVEGLFLAEDDLNDTEWEKEWGKQMKILEMVEIEEEILKCLPKAEESGVAQKLKKLISRKAELTRDR